MAEKGVVIGLKDNNLAVIKMTRQEACAKCRACIAGMAEKDMFIEAENICGAKVDDWVEVECHQTDLFMQCLLCMAYRFWLLWQALVLDTF